MAPGGTHDETRPPEAGRLRRWLRQRRESQPAPVEEPPPALRSVDVSTPPQPAQEPPSVPLRANGPREWNVWELDRLARDAAGVDPARDEERSLLLLHLRQFANAEGLLPVDFDGVVRESFGDLIARGRG